MTLRAAGPRFSRSCVRVESTIETPMDSTPPNRRRSPHSVTTGASLARFRGLWSGGLRCTSAEPWPEFTRLAVTVELPDGEPPLVVTGVVVECEPCAEEPGAFALALQLCDLPASALDQVHSKLVQLLASGATDSVAAPS